MLCELCHPTNERVLWQNDECRVIRVEQVGLASICRVIWQEHVADMTDLTIKQREGLMRVVWATEQALRTLLKPDKMNLASLGNWVPHLHWHVIARFQQDDFFPEAIWGSVQRKSELSYDKPSDLAITTAIEEALSKV